jgi:hypothetical protein
MSGNDFDEWIESAKSDLIEFNNCFQRKDFHKALYYLQQTLEKSAKASMMATSFSVANQPQKVKILKELNLPVFGPINYKHEWREVFINQVKKILSNPNLKEFIKLFENNGMKEIEDTITRALNVNDLKNPTESQITQTIKTSQNLLSKIDSKRIKFQIDEVLSEYLTLLDDIAKQYGINVKEVINLVKSYLNITIIIVALMLLSTLLNPFEQNRYPENFEKDKPLIPHLKQFKNILNHCIEDLEKSSWLN